MGNSCAAGAAWAAAAALFLVWAPGAAGAETVGQVVAVSGRVVAERAGEPSRSLACDDLVHEGETLVTSPGARARVLVGETFVQLDADSAVALGALEGAPDLGLEAGGLRLIDGGARGWRVRTHHGETQGAGGSDAEIWLRLEGPAAITRVCAHEGSVTATPSAGAPAAIPAGGCAHADEGSVSHHENPGPEIAVAEAPACRFDVAGVADRFTPTDVAAPLPGAGFPSVGAADLFRRDACDDPGSGCAGNPTPLPTPPSSSPPAPGPPIFVDPDPDTSCGGPGFPCPGNLEP